MSESFIQGMVKGEKVIESRWSRRTCIDGRIIWQQSFANTKWDKETSPHSIQWTQNMSGISEARAGAGAVTILILKHIKAIHRNTNLLAKLCVNFKLKDSKNTQTKAKP